MNKEYLGGGVYAEITGLGEVVLTAKNGEGFPINKIYLEPQVIKALLRFLKKNSYATTN